MREGCKRGLRKHASGASGPRADSAHLSKLAQPGFRSRLKWERMLRKEEKILSVILQMSFGIVGWKKQDFYGQTLEISFIIIFGENTRKGPTMKPGDTICQKIKPHGG